MQQLYAHLTIPKKYLYLTGYPLPLAACLADLTRSGKNRSHR
ncbi:hypothetical protein B6N60_00990 [Richelia sinica FACHB-800]|uniref:Uncharacterized protein n=1 Tax=Richelia sinica FACHB-800 TaxID=1357546 RepID=A0A975T517_9NOST|nr:hypothetical protein B6N60_00990 [Richelia sinica FACHB-800]